MSQLTHTFIGNAWSLFFKGNAVQDIFVKHGKRMKYLFTVVLGFVPALILQKSIAHPL